MYETVFIRCSPDVSEVKQSRTYSSVKCVKKHGDNSFNITYVNVAFDYCANVCSYRNDETELYYTPRASEVLQVFQDRLCFVV